MTQRCEIRIIYMSMCDTKLYSHISKIQPHLFSTEIYIYIQLQSYMQDSIYKLYVLLSGSLTWKYHFQMMNRLDNSEYFLTFFFFFISHHLSWLSTTTFCFHVLGFVFCHLFHWGSDSSFYFFFSTWWYNK